MDGIINEDKILYSFIPLVNFLGGAMGSECEIALHDVRNPNHSLIAICNSDKISGRKVGSPLTELGLKIIKGYAIDKKDYICRHPSKTKDGKILRSSSFFIKNNTGKVIGLLCINVNISDFIKSANFFNRFLSEISGGPERDLAKENKTMSTNLSCSIEELVMSIIENTLLETKISPERMSSGEKLNIVHKLDEKGVFLLKGVVKEVAKHLKTSENTIYRYLNNK